MNSAFTFIPKKTGRMAFGLLALSAAFWLTGCGGGGHSSPAPLVPPTVASLSPVTGPLAGGFQITLTGSGFTKATQVTFGTTPGLSLKVASDSSLTVFTPPGTGAVDVRVTTSVGQSSVVAGDRFTYQSSPGHYAFNYALNAPAGIGATGLATDSGGNLYIAYYGLNQVQKFDRFGNFLGRIGSTGTGPGQFSNPLGLAVDAADNLYVVDSFRIEKLNSAGVFQSQDTLFSDSYSALGVAVDGSGNVFATETDARGTGGVVEKFDSTGKELFVVGAGDRPLGIAVNGSGNTFISVDSIYSPPSYLLQLDSSGNQISQSVSEGGGGVALDSSGNLYIPQGTQVTKFDSKGNVITQIGSAGTGNGQFRAAGVITVGANGNVYVLDYDPTGEFSQPTRVEVFTPL